jgi:lambda family phage portal protein
MSWFSVITNPFTTKRRKQELEIQHLRARVSNLQQRTLTAALQNRLTEDWVAKRTALNDEIRGGLVLARSRARQLAREDDYGRKFTGMCRSNIVGPDGLKLELNIRDDNGKIDQRAHDKIKIAWDKWAKKQNFSTSQDFSFFDAQNTLATTTPSDGEYVVRMVKGYPHNPFKFAVQLIETDCLDENLNAQANSGNTVTMGVERDAYRRRVAYHIKAENPYESYTFNRKNKTERISAGEIIHGFVPIGINQVRGLPWFLSAMPRMQMLNGYEEAAIVAARTAACKMGFLVRKPDASGSYGGQDSDSDGNKIMDASPGSIEELPSGFGFESWDPSYPHTEHGSFIKTTLRGVSAGLLVSYNGLANDLEGVNYSSIRAGLIDERDMWKIIQRWKIEHLWNEIFANWLDMAIFTKQVDLPMAKYDKFNQPAFIPRRWPWVDPEKDMRAAILGIENFLTTRTDVIAEGGGSFDENVMTAEAEKKKLESADLKPTGLKGYAEEIPQEKPAPAPAQ